MSSIKQTGIFHTQLYLLIAMVSETTCFLYATRTAAAQELPRCYSAPYAEKAIVVDGRLDDATWATAPWTEDFVDIEGDRQPKPALQTRAKMAWDDNFLYVGAELKEPHLQGTLTVRDSVIFHDNDFEIFIDPDGDTNNYGEFEINTLNTGWDLRLTKPYSKGGEADDGHHQKADAKLLERLAGTGHHAVRIGARNAAPSTAPRPRRTPSTTRGPAQAERPPRWWRSDSRAQACVLRSLTAWCRRSRPV